MPSHLSSSSHGPGTTALWRGGHHHWRLRQSTGEPHTHTGLPRPRIDYNIYCRLLVLFALTHIVACGGGTRSRLPLVPRSRPNNLSIWLITQATCTQRLGRFLERCGHHPRAQVQCNSWMHANKVKRGLVASLAWDKSRASGHDSRALRHFPDAGDTAGEPCLACVPRLGRPL